MGIRILISIRGDDVRIKLIQAVSLEYLPKRGKAYVKDANGDLYVVYSRTSEEEIKLFAEQIDKALEIGYADLSGYESAYEMSSGRV